MHKPALEAMRFAIEKHGDQRRKYTGDLRTTDQSVIEEMTCLYECGLSVEDISAITGVRFSAIRNYVAKHAIYRKPEQFHRGIDVLAKDGEIFAPITWAKNYFVSDHGRVFCAAPLRQMKPHRSPKTNYLSVKLIESNGRCKSEYVHRIVLRAFVGDCPIGKQCAHGDGDRSNNRLSNLRWATPSENGMDKFSHGTVLFGDRHPNTRISTSTARAIVADLAAGFTHPEIAARHSVTLPTVANISTGRSWRHIRSGDDSSV